MIIRRFRGWSAPLLLLLATGSGIDTAGASDGARSPVTTAAPAVPALHGVVLARTGREPEARTYGSAASLAEVEDLARRGASAIALDVIAWVNQPDSPFVTTSVTDLANERTRLTRMATRARSLGLRVVVRARLDVQRGDPARSIGVRDESAWDKWFAEYRRFAVDAATLAADIDADLFVAGLSLGGTTEHEARWRGVIEAVRRAYSGPVTYGADAGDEIERVRFWNALDLVGVELFPALTRSDANPSSADEPDSVVIDALVDALRPHHERIAAVAVRVGRPVVITGAGFRSVPEAWRDADSALARLTQSDERDQRRAVAAVVRTFDRTPWLRGMLWWNWDLPVEDGNEAARRVRARDFCLAGKAASVELERAWAHPPLGWSASRPRGRGGVVVSSDSIATDVGIAVLREGGNAVDAAVATAFALAVTLPEAGNLGGGGFAITYDPRRRESRALDFRERAPERAHASTYVDLARKGVTDASTVGPLSAGIPGSVAGLHALWEAEGSLPWDRLLRPAFELAVEGFAIGAATARSIERERAVLEKYATTRALFLPGGRALREGERLVQPALAEVLLTLMREGPAPFYRGAIARRLLDDVREAGGLWTRDDLRDYRVQWRRPVHWPLTRDGRVELVTMGLPSSAGTVLPQVWTFMQAQGAEHSAADSPERAHAWIESFRLAFADRNTHLGDPAHTRMDERALVSAPYLRERARLIPSPGVAGSSADVRAGDPPSGRGRGRPREHDETTHLVVIDAEGRAVSLTTTLNGNYGSGWISPSTGILLNNQMDDFDTRPGEPNLYGLVGGDQNLVRPGARMLSSMSPVIVLRDGRTWLALGGRGGPRIATAVAQILYARVVDGWPLDRAVAAPRLHHQWIPDEVRLETGRSWPGLEEPLGAMGHTVSAWTKSGAVHAAEMLGDGLFVGVADPRERGLARCVDPETDDTIGDRDRFSPRPDRREP